MKGLATMTIFLAALLTVFLHGANVKLNQKKGIWQDKKEKQIEFVKFEKIGFDFGKVPLKMIQKIALHKNNIFILDGKRNQVYVIDKKGNYLYTIGRPGQGPGDIAGGWDFFISGGDRIYVLDAMSKRIEVFDIKGKPLNSIRIESSSLMHRPNSFVVDKNNNFIIGCTYCDDAISIYDIKGNYKRSILERVDMVGYKGIGPNLGIPARLELVGEDILYLDLFKGIFTKIDSSGSILAVFNANSDKLNQKVRDLEKEFRGNPKESNSTNYSSFSLWDSFCIDQFNRIYSVRLVREEGRYQYLVVFSPGGDFLYAKPLDFLKEMPVKNICCDKESFVFGTYNLDLIIAYRRVK